MRAIPVLISLLFFLPRMVWGQTEWDLKKCVEYAMQNNIQVKITDVQAKISEQNLIQSRLSRFPNMVFNGSSSVNSGLNQNPISFTQVTETYLAAGMQLQTSADIFNFYSRKNSIAAAEWEILASRASVDKLRYDIALNVSNAYLQILLAMEQEKIATVQVQQTQAQLENTRKLVNAGALPELNASQLEAQLALDSVNLISAKGNVSQTILALKSGMNLDPASPFNIATPPVEQIPVESISDLQPEYVYQMAMANQPQQKVNAFRLKAAEKNAASARGMMLPSLNAFGSLGTSFFNKAQELKGTTQIMAPIGSVTVNNNLYEVFPLNPFTIGIYGKSSFGHQLKDNFRQAVGLSLSVPIFSGGQLRTNYERSRLNIQNLKFQQEQDNAKLKQDIYQAYTAAVIAMQRFNGSQKTVETSEKAHDFAKRRYDVGMLSTFDLISAQNNLLRAKLEYSMNRFDYVFKLKVLEFYKGLGLKL